MAASMPSRLLMSPGDDLKTNQECIFDDLRVQSLKKTHERENSRIGLVQGLQAARLTF